MPLGRPATIDAKIISEMPLPMPRWVISSPIHINSTVPAVSEMTIRKTWGVSNFEMIDVPVDGPKRLEEEDVADRLREGQADREVARVLRDARLADLALLLELLQRGDDHREQLQDDARRDVGHDPEREERDAAQPAARERVQQVEDASPAERLLGVLDRLDVDAGNRDMGADAVERKQQRREGELLADLRDGERTQDGREHEEGRVTDDDPWSPVPWSRGRGALRAPGA